MVMTEEQLDEIVSNIIETIDYDMYKEMYVYGDEEDFSVVAEIYNLLVEKFDIKFTDSVLKSV